MKQQNSILGAGPQIVASTAAFFAFSLWLDGFAGLPPIADDPSYLHAAGAALLALACVLWAVLVRTILMMYKLDRLYRAGLYACCRHPLYANFVLLAVPGACLLANSWAALAAIPFAYLAVRFFVRKEERGLIAAFGAEYERYKQEVNAIFPNFRHLFSRQENRPPGAE